MIGLSIGERVASIVRLHPAQYRLCYDNNNEKLALKSGKWGIARTSVRTKGKGGGEEARVPDRNVRPNFSPRISRSPERRRIFRCSKHI